MKTTFKMNPRAAMWLLFAAGAVILAIAGCGSEVESGFATGQDEEALASFAPQPLKLVSVGVPNFSEEVARLWAAERDGELKIVHVSLDSFESGEKVPGDADLIVHPSSINVDLISKDLIRAFPREGLLSKEMNLDGFLMHFRKALVRHADKTWSVSFGGQQLRLFYRNDVLKAAGIDPPETWGDLQRAIEKLKGVDQAEGMASIVIPTDGEMASQMLMARAASEIRGQGKLTSFFDRKTMEPTIGSEPFVRALESVKRLAAESDEALSVAQAFEEFASGKAVFAIGWPVALDEASSERLESDSANWSVIRLPGSDSFYDLKESNWQKRRKGDDGRVDLLGIAATNVSIVAGSSKSKDAVEFVAWLVDKRNSRKVLLDVAAPFRATHLGRLGQWYSMEQVDRVFLDALADSIERTHKSKIFLMFPQLPGKRQYLSLLDQAVASCLAAESADAKTALENVAKDWESLTDSLGRDEQLRELRQGSGI